MEMHERLRSLRRCRFQPADLLAAIANQAAVGWPDAGRLALGCRADLVVIRLDSIRTAGCAPGQVLAAAAAANVDTVMVDGRVVVQGGGT